MGAFFKILLIAILIFYAFSMIIRLVFKRKMKKLQQHFEQPSQDGTKTPSEDVKTPHLDPNIGEYTDFEEIE